MATKLNWEYQDYGKHAGEYHAVHNGFRIRAVLDQDARNPFEDGEGHWPMMVRSDGAISRFSEMPDGPRINNPLAFISDPQIVHDQITIAKLLNVKIETLTAFVDDYGPRGVKYCHNAEVLREEFQNLLDDGRESDKLELYRDLYALAGVHAYCATSNGYSQGHSAEVLVVATPEAIEEHSIDERQMRLAAQCAAEPPWMPDGDPEKAVERELKKLWDTVLANQIKLYGAWAWGNVYGYVIEKPVPRTFDELAQRQDVETIAALGCDRYRCVDDVGDDLDGTLEEIADWLDAGLSEPEPREWKEIDSCWGFYGADFDWSGLEEAAMEACPDEEKIDA